MYKLMFYLLWYVGLERRVAVLHISSLVLLFKLTINYHQ